MGMLDEQLYRGLGEFVVKFQMLENELGEIVWYCMSPTLSKQKERKPERPIGEQTFGQLLKTAARNVPPALELYGAHSAQLRARFDGLLERCQFLVDRRNALLHAVYQQVETSDSGVAIVRRRTRRESAHQVQPSYEALNEDSFAPAISEIRDLYGELFQFHRELMYSHRLEET